MNRAAIWVMRAVVVLEALWFALVLLLFNFKLPMGFIFFVGTWVMLIVALYLFASRKGAAALCLSYVAVIAGTLLLGFGGDGSPHLLESLYRDTPNFIFLIAAHYAYTELNQKPVPRCSRQHPEKHDALHRVEGATRYPTLR